MTIFQHHHDLAAACGVSRRRIYKWRERMGGPAGLDGPTWLGWLSKQTSDGCQAAAKRLRAALAMPAAPAAGAQALLSLGPAAAPAPQAHSAPPDNDGVALRNARQREQYLLAKLEREAAEGRSIPTDLVEALLAGLGEWWLGELGGIQVALRVPLEGADLLLRRAVNDRLASHLLEMRVRLQAHCRDQLAELARQAVARSLKNPNAVPPL